MIYFSYLKSEDFDPEFKMRIKLFCDCTIDKEENFVPKQGWMCIYGLKSAQVKETATNLTKNEKRVIVHLNSVWEYNEKEEKYVLIDKY